MNNSIQPAQSNSTSASALTRRDLLTTTAFIGVGLALAPRAWAATAQTKGPTTITSENSAISKSRHLVPGA